MGLLRQGFLVNSEKIMRIPSDQQKRSSSKSPDTVSQGGYSPNFGIGVGGGGIKGVEGSIMSHVFKPLITRFVESVKEIKTPDSMVSIAIHSF